LGNAQEQFVNDGAAMQRLSSDHPTVISLSEAVRNGDLALLKRLLGEHPGLASTRIDKDGKSRTVLHIATDWPGHFPNGAAIVATLIDAGADPNVAQEGTRYAETRSTGLRAATISRCSRFW
jgi:hypothetical protein